VVFALIRKETLAILKDPANRVVLIAPAFIQALLFGYGATYDLVHVPYAVLDRDRSAASSELLARLEGAAIFQRPATLASPVQFPQVIADALLIVTIPEDFEARLSAGRDAPVQLILDGRNPVSSSAAAAHVAAVVARFNEARGVRSPV